MGENPKFGDYFEIKGGNRLDTIHATPKLPEYVAESRNIRDLLHEAAEEETGWEVMPQDIKSVEDLFRRSKDLVTTTWGKKVHEYLAQKCQSWSEQLRDKPEYVQEAELLANPDVLEQKLMIQQFGVLESLRNVLPKVWRELVLIASERQLAAVTVARRWIKELPNDRAKEFAGFCGVESIKELEIFVDMAAIMGKYIDQAYVKQIELADAPGGSSITPESERLKDIKPVNVKHVKGLKYLYDVPTRDEDKKIDFKPYADVFPFEIDRLTKSFKQLALKIEKNIQQTELGEGYKDLAAYLKDMAEAYGSKNNEPEKLYELWAGLSARMTKLAQDGCPIMLVPQAVASIAGKADKIDIELRLGFITKEAREMVHDIEPFRVTAQQLVDEQRPFLERDHKVPPVIVNSQPFAFGPNVYWATRGQRGQEKIMAHTNAVADVAVTTALPILQATFADAPDEEMFKRATNWDNTLHELGHTLAPLEDSLVAERVGSTPEKNIAEELKADTGGLKLLQKTLEKGPVESVDIKNQILAKLGDVCDYLKNKSSAAGSGGERYYYDGVAIIARLFEKNLLVEQEGKYKVTDYTEALHALAEINDELMELYLKGTSDKLRDYVQAIRDKKNDPKVAVFIKTLQGK